MLLLYQRKSGRVLEESHRHSLWREDNLCEFDVVSSFANKFECALEVMNPGEHYFYTPEQLKQLNFFDDG